MKLLYCPYCKDIFNLRSHEKSCTCGKTRGRYVDKINANYTGGVPFGIANSSFENALRKQPQIGEGVDFRGFIVPMQSDTFKLI